MDGNADTDFALSSVFNESYFVIPDYQRDYAWSESNVGDLLDDARFVYEENKNHQDSRDVKHYFGTIVLEERETISPTEYEDYTEYAIVDGQQRLATLVITISCIVNEMRLIASDGSADEQMKSNINDRSEDIYKNYVEYEGTLRVSLGGLSEDVYQAVVRDDIDPEAYIENAELVEAERRVANARDVIERRLSQWREETLEGGTRSGYAEYYKFLKNIIKILTQRFEVNVKIVKDVDEAARMFKVINNRGRGLTLHDKVRSHLVYCASQSVSLDSEEIYRRFNRIIKNITIHDGFTDEDVDNLVKLHWAVFASERSDSRSKRPGPAEIHKRLSESEEFASVRRDQFEDFVEPYLNSLERFSERYPYLSDRDRFAEKYYDSDSLDISKSLMAETVHKIQSIYIHSPARRSTTPLLIAVAEKFGVDSQEFADVVDELEKLTFRYGLVMSHGAQGYSNVLSTIANDLYWADQPDEAAARVFNSDSDRYTGYDSVDLGIQKVKQRIRNKRERIAPIDETINEYIAQSDIIDGDFTPGWGGVRNAETIKHMMYEYERYLRTHSGQLSLAPYHEIRDEFEVEHLVPKNAEAGHRLEDHEQHRNRLGNLAILSSSDNNSENNNSFNEKYHSLYQESSLKILSELSGPKFTVDDIQRREEEDLFPFIKERWG